MGSFPSFQAALCALASLPLIPSGRAPQHTSNGQRERSRGRSLPLQEGEGAGPGGEGVESASRFFLQRFLFAFKSNGLPLPLCRLNYAAVCCTIFLLAYFLPLSTGSDVWGCY